MTGPATFGQWSPAGGGDLVAAFGARVTKLFDLMCEEAEKIGEDHARAKFAKSYGVAVRMLKAAEGVVVT